MTTKDIAQFQLNLRTSLRTAIITCSMEAKEATEPDDQLNHQLASSIVMILAECIVEVANSWVGPEKGLEFISRAVNTISISRK